MIIQKGGRHMGKTAQMKLESFDALLDAYMELVEEKKKQDPNYVPKIVYVGMKYTKPKPRTNFDKIKAMSVEEFAEFTTMELEYGVAHIPYYQSTDGEDFDTEDEALKHSIEWLQKEIEG